MPDRATYSYGKNWNPVDHYKDVLIAENYDRERFSSPVGRLFDRLEKRAVRRAFGSLVPGASIADVPCGTGRLSETLLRRGFSVTGVDVSPAMLDVAKRKLALHQGRFQALVLDARQLPESGLRVDAALCARVLMHFPLEEQIGFLGGVARVARDLVVFTHGINSPTQRVRRVTKSVVSGFRKPAIYPVTEDDLATLIRGAGLRELRRFHVLPVASEAIVVVTRPEFR